MSRWPQATLGDVAIAKPGNGKIIKGSLPTENNGRLFPAYSATGQDVFSGEYDHEGDGIIVSAVGARCGKCFLATGRWRAIANTHVLLPRKDKILQRFLWYVVNDENFWIKGGTAQPFVKVNDSLKNVIPLPPLPEQQRLVQILDEVEALRRRRTEVDQRTGTLISSLLDSMFGDPVSNPKGIKLVRLAEITTKVTDGVHLKPDYTESGIPFISVKDVTTGTLRFSDCKFISLADHQKFTKRCKPEHLDILYTKVGTYGQAVLVETTQEFSIYVSVCLIKPDRELVDPHYLNEVLNTAAVKRQADQRIKGIGVPDLHLDQIREFLIPLPPLSLQGEFAARAGEINRLKALQASSRQRLDNLFQSLLHRALQGEL